MQLRLPWAGSRREAEGEEFAAAAAIRPPRMRLRMVLLQLLQGLPLPDPEVQSVALCRILAMTHRSHAELAVRAASTVRLLLLRR